MTARRCIVCSGQVDEMAMPEHTAWHGRVAQASAEQAQRIDELTALVQELEAGHGDR